MSIVSAMDDRRDGVEEGERALAGQRGRSPAASAGEVSGPVATMTLSQSAGGRPATSPRSTRDQRMADDRRRRPPCGEAVAVDRQRAAGRHLMRVGARA